MSKWAAGYPHLSHLPARLSPGCTGEGVGMYTFSAILYPAWVGWCLPLSACLPAGKLLLWPGSRLHFPPSFHTLLSVYLATNTALLETVPLTLLRNFLTGTSVAILLSGKRTSRLTGSPALSHFKFLVTWFFWYTLSKNVNGLRMYKTGHVLKDSFKKIFPFPHSLIHPLENVNLLWMTALYWS